MKFHEKLQNLRKEKGMSQEALAYELGVSRQAVSKWESGQVYPETDKLIQLGKLFHVSIDYLLNEENEQREAPEQVSEECFLYTAEMIEEELRWKKRFGLCISLGVVLLVMGTSFPILINSDIGAAAFLATTAIAVAIFVSAGMMNSHRSHLQQRIYVKKSDIALLEQRYAKFRSRFTALITAGVFLCIIGVASIVAFDEIYGESDRHAPILFLFVSIALLLIIPAGIQHSAYRRLIEFEKGNAELETQQKEQHSRFAFLWGVTMPLASMYYVWDAYQSDDWTRPTWIVIAVTAVLTGGLVHFLNMICESRGKRGEENES